MNLLKPTKLTFAIFGLLFLLSVSSYILPFLAPFALFNLISILLIFTIFKNLGINVGYLTGGPFRFPEPNILGWVLIILIIGCFYYLIASLISYIIKNEKKRSIIFYIICFIAIICIFGSFSYWIISAKKQEPIVRCSGECLTLGTEIYNSCTNECRSTFPSYKPSEAYNSCMYNCDSKRSDFVKQCNNQCLSR
ncbi:MAG: hypothetical protein A3G46_01240 [Candidatus Zambryskibacteria bacterium RIFCSPLOWO2_12_FULL_39_16]|uniref:Uncharacterized protein n=1 Tax=Candidatus Zambryskibacteria bacterium RIFCSPLOWO2_12_FULL_39_16 TaxID=1802775 RepID=A0A1G2USF5_9BACT|nr:MAG: hypothetical protein A3G46_01240 [Candidatus Zambryskibacteria bacterium RIFCSPLOWO2_12_FULL_39_16]